MSWYIGDTYTKLPFVLPSILLKVVLINKYVGSSGLIIIKKGGGLN